MHQSKTGNQPISGQQNATWYITNCALRGNAKWILEAVRNYLNGNPQMQIHPG